MQPPFCPGGPTSLSSDDLKLSRTVFVAKKKCTKMPSGPSSLVDNSGIGNKQIRCGTFVTRVQHFRIRPIARSNAISSRDSSTQTKRATSPTRPPSHHNRPRHPLMATGAAAGGVTGSGGGVLAATPAAAAPPGRPAAASGTASALPSSVSSEPFAEAAPVTRPQPRPQRRRTGSASRTALQGDNKR